MLSVKDYIKSVLKDIREAQTEEASFLGVRGVVDFDIATVASDNSKAGIKVGVWSIGGEVGANSNNQVTSRVKFSVQTRGAIAPSR